MKRLVFVLSLSLTAATAGAATQKPGHGNPHKAEQRDYDDGHGKVAVRFSTGDERLIHEYYDPSRYRSLPPGLRKKVARGEELPPGWQKRMQPFPVDLERRLGPLPRGYRRGVYDGRGVIYDSRSHVVIDVTILF